MQILSSRAPKAMNSPLLVSPRTISRGHWLLYLALVALPITSLGACATESPADDSEKVDNKLFGSVQYLSLVPLIQWGLRQVTHAQWRGQLQAEVEKRFDRIAEVAQGLALPSEVDLLEETTAREGEHFANHYVIGNFINEGDEKLQYACGYLWSQYENYAAALVETIPLIARLQSEAPDEFPLLTDEYRNLYKFFVEANELYRRQNRNPEDFGIKALESNGVVVTPAAIVSANLSALMGTAFFEVAGTTSGCSAFLGAQ